ncbi:amidase [Permianibacter aggregans]|uniref:Amidase n=1 Tax=Permianibacter aggregans TaxID=1510150 RepID=A0A4R6UZ68_9GAMM|nr:amidase [Permianibacter aggregans]TDQ51303.1 amidase [Permianibacter aggregans]
MHWLNAVLLCLVLTVTVGCEQKPKQATPPPTPAYSVLNKSISELRSDLDAGKVTAVELVEAYAKRIEQMDDQGPTFRAVISLNPDAKTIAAQLDAERKNSGIRSPLHGIPIMLKDNIDTADKMPTTAGSLALKNHFAQNDSTVAKKLREAGAIILGKANLSEWANFRSSLSTSGWSAIEGFTRYPFDPLRNTCGSSSGSAVVVAMSFAAAAIGTETDGSIVCPSGMQSLVGVKPTVGLVSRAGIIPIAESQDTAGPMTRTVEDAILIMSVIAGSDGRDPATKQADVFKAQYRSSLRVDALNNTRIGVLRFALPSHPEVKAQFEKALTTLQENGAKLIDIESVDGLDQIYHDEFQVLLSEFHDGINRYLADTDPTQVSTRSLSDLIAFNEATPAELQYFHQDLFKQAVDAPAIDSKEYQQARVQAQKKAGPEGIDKLLREHHLDALVAITNGPSWMTDTVNGDHYTGGASTLPAVAGYPHITVPLGSVRDLPIGLSFIGTAWSESPLLAIAYAFEQKMPARVLAPDPDMPLSPTDNTIQ